MASFYVLVVVRCSPGFVPEYESDVQISPCELFLSIREYRLNEYFIRPSQGCNSFEKACDTTSKKRRTVKGDKMVTWFGGAFSPKDRG